ncbi:MAG: hypothetical protein IJR48_02320, partial [Oscillibacter sp.]|nr:hypothetical protein [Oscillibacter sp.]
MRTSMLLLVATLWSMCLFLLTACGSTPAVESASGGSAATETVSGTAADSVSVTETLSGTDLTVVCFQAGKADAFLLITPNSTVLIDCGEKGFGRTILAELEARGIEQLDCMII